LRFQRHAEQDAAGYFELISVFGLKDPVHRVSGTRLVEVPIVVPSRMNLQLLGLYSITAVCQSGNLALEL
jgi:hypothetical protein